MIRLLKQLKGGEKGQALPIVLVLLALGGLTITPSLNYAATSLNNTRSIENGMDGIYAAGAGVEYVLWYLGDNLTPPTQLGENINQMEVAVQTEDKGAYTIVFGELIEAGGHSNYLDVDGTIEAVGGDTYKYTIVITWQPESGTANIKLREVGVRLPLGYIYQTNSAASFPDNLSLAEPDEVQDAAGAWMLNWEFSTPYPSVSESEPVKTQVFYITGTEDLEGDYVWVVANRADVGQVGEVTGNLYIVTATATKDDETAAIIVADVMMNSGTATIISWQLSR